MDVEQNAVTFVCITVAHIHAYACGYADGIGIAAQEDLELLAFSSEDLIRNFKQVIAEQGLPLKAVYRESIVGIRYMHPRTVAPGTTPVRRVNAPMYARVY